MKNIFISLLLILSAVFCLSSCNKDSWKDGADLTYLSISYDNDGNSLPVFPKEGKAITRAVAINQGSINRDIDWTVTVDNEPAWITVEKTTVTSNFVGTYGGDDREIENKGVIITVDANDTGNKRTAVIRFTVADGSSISTVVTQNK